MGAGALMAVSMALVKDCFVEERREQMIAIIQVLSVVGPVIAPLIGGFLLNFFDWRASFVALAVFGAVCLSFAVLFEESLPESERRAGGIGSTIGGLVAVGRNRAFMTLLLMVALFNVAFSAYLAVGSYIYVDFFGTTPQEYTYFFAVTAAFTALGPYIWLKAKAHITPRRFTHLMIALGFVSAILLLTIGESSVFAFCGSLILFATIQSALRPYTTNILLSQQKGDTGAASSLIGFMISIFGVIGMSVIVMGWPTYIFGIGAIMLICAALSLALWDLPAPIPENAHQRAGMRADGLATVKRPDPSGIIQATITSSSDWWKTSERGFRLTSTAGCPTPLPSRSRKGASRRSSRRRMRSCKHARGAASMHQRTPFDRPPCARASRLMGAHSLVATRLRRLA